MEARYKNKKIDDKFEGTSRLGYSIQGKRGGNPQVKDDVGMVCAFIDNTNGNFYGGNYILVDAFNGSGDTYGRLEKCDISITKSGKELFSGDFNKLCGILEDYSNGTNSDTICTRLSTENEK